MKTVSEKDIDFDLTIDINTLEKEWAEQPRLRFRYGVKLAEAAKRVAEAKAEMELTYAELDTSIRADPEKFELGKVTEASLKATILNQKSYDQARKALIQSQYEESVLQAAVSAIDQRRFGLQKEVDLWLGDYFSTPRASAKNREQMDEATKRIGRGSGRDRESSENNE